MVMRSSTQSISKGGTRKGVLLLLVLTVLSVLSVNISSRQIGFIFLPLIAVCLWPRINSPIASIIFILLFGFILDILSAGPLGLWSIIFLTVFAFIRPHQRIKPQTFISTFRLWIAVLGFAFVAAYLLGWFAMRNRPDIWPLLYQAAAAMVLFPAVYGMRHLGKNLLSDSDTGGL